MDNTPAKGPVLRLEDLAYRTQVHGETFEARYAAIAHPAGASRLGARVVEVPPGKRAWPYHCHHANDEMFVILSGEGELRFGGALHPVRAGDVVICPAGGPETAHQLRATGIEPLRYIAVSTMNEPDVMEYPDSGKVTVFAGAAPGGDKDLRRVAMTVEASSAVDYWKGES